MTDVDTLAIRGRLWRARRGRNRDELARRYVTDVKALLDALDERDQWIHEHALVKTLARAEAAEAVVRSVLLLHEPVDVWQYDESEGVFVLDDNGERILMRRFCRECCADDVIQAVEDCEWHDGWHSGEVEWPCETAVLVDPNAWVDDLVVAALANGAES